jgi:predicted ArsR family transcriptional regulator
MLHTQFFESSRGRIVKALRHRTMTAEELAGTLGQTAHAVRAQLRAMERDGLLEAAGFRPGTTRPFAVYRLTAEAEQLLSRAYRPFLARLVEVFASRHDAQELETVMRDTGRALADDFRGRVDQRRPLLARLTAASELLNEEFAAVTRVEQDALGTAIKGPSCPLSAVTAKSRSACLAIESLLEECLGVPVRQCCERVGRPTCCFRLLGDDPPRAATRRARARR